MYKIGLIISAGCCLMKRHGNEMFFKCKSAPNVTPLGLG
jgi:hypothetical protein